MEVMLLGRVTLVRPLHPENALSPMEVMLLGRVTPVRPVHPRNAQSPMDLTGKPPIVSGMTKLPEAFGLEPVMLMVFPMVWYDNSADRKVEEKRRRERKQAEEFLRKGNIFIFRATDRNLLFEAEFKRENWFSLARSNNVFSFKISCQGGCRLSFLLAI
jgi:hypothetical protein